MPSKIEWTQETWNPVTGCTPVSAGCEHCYAERMARRLHGRYGYPEIPDHFRVTLHPNRLREPQRWKKPQMIFVCSMGDLFHENVPSEYIGSVFDVMRSCPQHTFQVLTKRPWRMRDFLGTVKLPNVWLGVTIENQDMVRVRLPYLMETPAAVRFVSCEPLLGPINLGLTGTCPMSWGKGYSMVGDHLNWVIVGGESGPGARLMKTAWAVDVVEQCRAVGVPCFVKQMGSAWAKKVGARHKKGDEPSEWPEVLRVREGF